MKRIILSIFACCACVLMAMAQNRLDVRTADGKIKSVMVDNIKQMKYARSANITESDGYDQVVIDLLDGSQVVWDMNLYDQILYMRPTKEWLEIERTNDAHSWIIMYDCINNEGVMDPNKPLDWTAERCGHIPHFDYFAEKGFDPYYSLTGQYTGTVYSDIEGFVWWSLPQENYLGFSSWAFIMPNEPVTIAVTSVERTTYDGQPFLGEYKGYPVKIGDNRLYYGGDSDFTISFKGNETYKINTTDDNKFSFVEWYDYNADNNTFAYQEKPFEGLEFKEDTYAASGKFFNDDVFADVFDLNVNKIENTKFYFGSKDLKDYVCAAKDEYGYEYLVEATDSKDVKRWYFLSNYGLEKKAATLDFYFGNTIGAQCEAFVSFDGDIQYKYVLEYNAAPKFIKKGIEAGTYKCTEQGAPDITFDGFGYATYDGKTCNYSMDGSIATVIISGESHIFSLDIEAKTYTEIKSEEWTGPKDFVNNGVYGYFAGEEANSLNKVYVSLDKNLMGEDKPGYAAISIELERYASYVNAVADCQKYIWNSEKRTLTITNVLVGMKDGGSARRSLVFHVTDDMHGIYLEGSEEDTKVYATSYTGSYVQLNQDNALTAPKEEKLPASEYSGMFKILYFGQESGDAECTLLIDKDIDGSDKPGYAAISVPFMGAFIMNTSVPYTFENNTLTLKGITVGDGNYGTLSADIVFTLDAEGNLVGSEAYYGADMDTAFMQIDFSKGAFAPKAEEPALEPDYSGLFTVLYFGQESGEAECLLKINQDAEGNEKAGYATIMVPFMGAYILNATTTYTFENNVLTLEGITVGDGNYGTLTEDITFTLTEEGRLAGSAAYYGSDMNTAFMQIDFSKGEFAPVTAE